MNTYVEGDWHVAVIVAAVEALGGEYVEIGVRRGTCFDRVAPLATEAHAVDPDPGAKATGGRFWRMTSDEFFAVYPGRPHVVFIDGDHSYEQARRDFENAMRVLAADGLVFLHDTWPVDRRAEADTGTVWKLAVELEQDQAFNVATYRRYPGLTVVQRPRLERFP